MKVDTKQTGRRERRGMGALAGLACGLAVWLSGCTTGPGGFAPADGQGPLSAPVEGAHYRLGPMPGAPAEAAPSPREERPAEERPGLATGYGKRLQDEWHQQTFVRAGGGPVGTDVIYYNDREGVDAMTGGYKYRVDGMQTAAGERIEWGVRGGISHLPSYKSAGKRFVVGSNGSSYSVVIRNRCRSRLEVVLSVDGLDVIDGKPAAYSKRGYIVGPDETLEVKGWRTGWDSVARFEFSGVGDSYSNRRHGTARNVGVIGVAVFGEKGVDPWKWMPGEVRQRQTANPFATAP